MLTSTNANGLVSYMNYDEASRLLGITLPQPALSFQYAFINYTYDNSAMTTTQSEVVTNRFCVQPYCTPTVEAQTVTQLNGLGLAESVQSNVASAWDAVTRQYDAMGRLWEVSQPYQIPQQPSLWTIYTYDSLGRITLIQNPNGGQKSITRRHQPASFPRLNRPRGDGARR